MTTINGNRNCVPGTSTASSNGPVIDGFAKLETDILCYQHLLSRGMLEAAEAVKKEITSRELPNYTNLNNQRIPYTFDDFLRMYADDRITLFKLLCELKKVKSNPNIRERPELRIYNRSILPDTEREHGINSQINDLHRNKHLSLRVLRRLKVCGVGTMRVVNGGLNLSSVLDAAYRDPRNYVRMNLLYKVYIHTKAIYSLQADRLGRFLITGSDDHSIKVFDTENGLIRASLRGHHAALAEVSVSFDNKVLGSVSTDGWILFWNLENGAPIADYSPHTSEVTSLKLLPFIDGDLRYAVSIGRDGNIVFYVYNNKTLEFDTNVIPFNVKTGAKSSSINGLAYSPGGQFVVFGSYRSIYVYKLEGDRKFQRMFEHQSSMDRVDSVDWAHFGVKFATGSFDGLIRIYTNQGNSFTNVCARIPQVDKALVGAQNKFVNKVVMLKFSPSDDVLIVSASDHIIRTYCAETATFLKSYHGHQDTIYIIVPHPIHENVVVTSGHDGIINIWNFHTGQTYKRLDNYATNGSNQIRVQILDIVYCKETSDIYISDMSGHISCFSLRDPTSDLSKTPEQQFFASEYRKSVMTGSRYLEDEMTRRKFYELPPTSLLNADQIPYESEIQRKIPGHAWINPNDEVDIGESVWSELDLITQIEEDVLQKMDTAQRCRQHHELARFAISSASHNDAPCTAVAVVQRNHPTILQDYGRILRTGLPGDIALLPVEDVMIDDSEDTSDESYHGNESDANPVVIEMDNENDLDFVPGPALRGRRPNSLRGPNRLNVTGTRSRPRIAPPNLNGNNVVPNVRRTRLRARLNGNVEEALPEEELPPVRRSRRGAARAVISSEDEGSDERGERRNRLAMMEELAELNPRAATPDSENGDRSSNEESSMSDEQRDDSRSEESVGEEEAPGSNESIEDVIEMPNDCNVDLNGKYPAFSQVYKLRRFPYYPQIGDHIVYFKQGYEAYQAEVKKQKLYTISKSKKRNMLIDQKLNAETFCVVTKIEYLSNPKALIHVTVTVTDEVKFCNGESFEIYYNDCNDVADFLILREYYDIALRQKFKPSNKVETIMLDESKFYTGTVESIRVFDEAWPKSLWNRVIVRWNYDPATTYAASAWEIDGVKEGRVDGELATDEEYARLARIATNSQDWGEKDMDVVLDRVKAAIMLMMRSEEIEIFNDPVDFNLYPDYLDIVPYPIDLSVIVKRIENKFYRRLVALEQDIKQIAINSKLYNGDIDITKTAQALVEALLTYINSDETDVEAVFEECMEKNAADLKKYSETPDEESLLTFINAAFWEENPAPTEDSIWWRPIIRKYFKEYSDKWIDKMNSDLDIVDDEGFPLCSNFEVIYNSVLDENFTDYEDVREQLRSLIEDYEQNDERSRDSEKYVSDMKNTLLSPMEQLISRIENCIRNENQQEVSNSAFDIEPRRRPGLRQQQQRRQPTSFADYDVTMDSASSSRSKKTSRKRKVVNYSEANLSRIGRPVTNITNGRVLRKRPPVSRFLEDDGTTSEEEMPSPVKTKRHTRIKRRRLNSEDGTEDDEESHTSSNNTSTNSRPQRSTRVNSSRVNYNENQSP
uniref:WD_REPEATS_REGION domain-containing protein n=1 Tax=Rhabditophanes sp. KR3021 TaxID=114890 RepID=A0AC35TW21_9BILA